MSEQIGELEGFGGVELPPIRQVDPWKNLPIWVSRHACEELMKDIRSCPRESPRAVIIKLMRTARRLPRTDEEVERGSKAFYQNGAFVFVVKLQQMGRRQRVYRFVVTCYQLFRRKQRRRARFSRARDNQQWRREQYEDERG